MAVDVRKEYVSAYRSRDRLCCERRALELGLVPVSLSAWSLICARPPKHTRHSPPERHCASVFSPGILKSKLADVKERRDRESVCRGSEEKTCLDFVSLETFPRL